MKYLVAQWRPEESHYNMALYVVISNHPRFVEGSRFDFGFLNIASCEGYTITILPSEQTIDKRIKDGHFKVEKG